MPVHDQRSGDMIAVAGLAGPALQMQPAASAFTAALAALGEHEVTLAHQRELADLRNAGRSQLAGVHGPGLLIDDDGWESVYGPVEDEESTAALKRVATSIPAAAQHKPWCRGS